MSPYPHPRERQAPSASARQMYLKPSPIAMRRWNIGTRLRLGPELVAGELRLVEGPAADLSDSALTGCVGLALCVQRSGGRVVAQALW